MPYTEDGKFVYTLSNSPRKAKRSLKNQPEIEADPLPLQFQIAVHRLSQAEAKPIITITDAYILPLRPRNSGVQRLAIYLEVEISIEEGAA